MKKILLFIICALLSLSLIGCSISDLVSKIQEDYTSDTDETDDDNKGGDETSGGESQGGDNQQGKKEEIKFNLPNEFDIEYKLKTIVDGNTENETQTEISTHFALCKDGALMNISGAEILYLFKGDLAYICNFDEEKDMFVYSNLNQKMEDAVSSVKKLLSNYSDIGKDNYYTKSGTETILGRKCDYYTGSDSENFTNSTFEIYRDQETNLLLKYHIKVTSTISANVSRELYYDVTKFVTKDVTLPSHQGFATSIENAFVGFSATEPAEKIVVGVLYSIFATYSPENTIGSFIPTCESENCEIETAYGLNAITFTAPGNYTIKLNGVGNGYVINVVVVEE